MFCRPTSLIPGRHILARTTHTTLHNYTTQDNTIQYITHTSMLHTASVQLVNALRVNTLIMFDRGSRPVASHPGGGGGGGLNLDGWNTGAGTGFPEGGGGEDIHNKGGGVIGPGHAHFA